jgi:hypothetical protein
MGVVFMKGGHPMSYHSKMFHGGVMNYPTYDKELYFLVQSIDKWNYYLRLRKPSSTPITRNCNTYEPKVNLNKKDITSGWGLVFNYILS